MPVIPTGHTPDHGDPGVTSTDEGDERQTAALRDRASHAARALLLVAVLEALFGAIATLGFDLPIRIFAIPAAFFGLFLWARRNPLPAALTGLVLFVSLELVPAIADRRSLTHGFLTKIILIVILAKALQLGMQHRNTERHARHRP